jgi:hypothetical protein
VELQGVHSPLQLLNSKNLLSKNKTDHVQLTGSTTIKNAGARSVMKSF